VESVNMSIDFTKHAFYLSSKTHTRKKKPLQFIGKQIKALRK